MTWEIERGFDGRPEQLVFAPPARQLKAYMAYDDIAGSDEGACLVFAHTAKKARRLAWPTLRGWFDTDWLDARVKWIRDRPHVFGYADQEKFWRGEPHVIDCPRGCYVCGVWTEPLVAGRCADCRGEEAGDMEDEIE